MDIRPIKTKEDYELALAEITQLFEVDPDMPKGDRLGVLVTLLEAYEDQVAAYASGEADRNIYSRGGHPNRAALAAKLAALGGFQLIRAARAAGDEGPVVGAENFSSGMAAVSAALLGLAQAGDHVITQSPTRMTLKLLSITLLTHG